MEKNKDLVILGKQLRLQRVKNGLTQVELASKAALDRNYVGMIERGERNPSYLSLQEISKEGEAGRKKIAKVLNITVGELLTL